MGSHTARARDRPTREGGGLAGASASADVEGFGTPEELHASHILSLSTDLPVAVGTALGTGLCGALTTYGTFGFETVRLFEDGARFHALSNAVVTVLAGLGSAGLGWAPAQALWG